MNREREYLGLPVKKRVVFSNPPGPNMCNDEPFLGELEKDTHTYLSVDNRGLIALVQKSRPYISGPADLMLIPAYRSVSQICELDDNEGQSLLEMSGVIANSMVEISGDKNCGRPVIALNQQPSCVSLPGKYEEGVEVKIQTIDQLHLHIFLEDGEGDPFLTIGALSAEDKKDFLDIPGLVLSEALFPDVDHQATALNSLAETRFSLDKYPLGINIRWGRKITDITGDPKAFDFIKHVQDRLATAYQDFCRCLTVGGDDWWLGRSQLRFSDERIARTEVLLETTYKHISDFGKRVALLIARNIVPGELEERRYLKMLYGPSCTWIFFEDSSGAYIHFSPKVLSRGNAMECLGIWKDQFEEADEARQRLQHSFYLDLQENLATRGYEVQKGPLLTEG